MGLRSVHASQYEAPTLGVRVLTLGVRGLVVWGKHLRKEGRTGLSVGGCVCGPSNVRASSCTSPSWTPLWVLRACRAKSWDGGMGLGDVEHWINMHWINIVHPLPPPPLEVLGDKLSQPGKFFGATPLPSFFFGGGGGRPHNAVVY